MKNYIQHVGNIPLTAPAGGVVAGLSYLIGAIFGVAMTSAAEGASFELRREGMMSFAKTTAEAWTEGQVLYFDPATGKLTTTAGALKKVALAAAAAPASATSGAAIVLPLAL